MAAALAAAELQTAAHPEGDAAPPEPESPLPQPRLPERAILASEVPQEPVAVTCTPSPATRGASMAEVTPAAAEGSSLSAAAAAASAAASLAAAVGVAPCLGARPIPSSYSPAAGSPRTIGRQISSVSGSAAVMGSIGHRLGPHAFAAFAGSPPYMPSPMEQRRSIEEAEREAQAAAIAHAKATGRPAVVVTPLVTTAMPMPSRHETIMAQAAPAQIVVPPPGAHPVHASFQPQHRVAHAPPTWGTPQPGRGGETPGALVRSYALPSQPPGGWGCTPTAARPLTGSQGNSVVTSPPGPTALQGSLAMTAPSPAMPRAWLPNFATHMDGCASSGYAATTPRRAMSPGRIVHVRAVSPFRPPQMSATMPLQPRLGAHSPPRAHTWVHGSAQQVVASPRVYYTGLPTMAQYIHGMDGQVRVAAAASQAQGSMAAPDADDTDVGRDLAPAWSSSVTRRPDPSEPLSELYTSPIQAHDFFTKSLCDSKKAADRWDAGGGHSGRHADNEASAFPELNAIRVADPELRYTPQAQVEMNFRASLRGR